VEAMLQRVNLFKVRSKYLSTYSGGMKQRFGIAQALLANPKLIIVDEPTAGLDPAERNRFLNLLGELGENTIVILSTHIVEDVKELCTNMAIINKGEVLMTGSPLDALETLKGKVWRKRIEKSELARMEKHYNVISQKLISGKPTIHVVSENDLRSEGFEARESDLEDVYFSCINKTVQAVV
jgi:ABC-type multidrug transport system ATPase subunit